jgi:short-subunit dehydrogenase
MKKILILGSTGGIGFSLKEKLYNNIIIYPSKTELNLETTDNISEYLTKINPDIIINAAGVFGDNSVDFNQIFNVNLKSNWDIMNYYINNPPDKIIKFIMIGSSSYINGRKNYILYASSKSALHNMFQGASELLANTNVVLGLVHPIKTDTKMLNSLKNVDRLDCLSPDYVADKIIEFISKLEKSSYININ